MSSVVQAGRQQPMFIAEILALILSHLDRRDVARATQVCRQWSEVAIDTLWYLVTDLRPLLTLLAPLMSSEIRSGGSAFRGSISVLVSLPNLPSPKLFSLPPSFLFHTRLMHLMFHRNFGVHYAQPTGRASTATHIECDLSI
jgi:hypothetical protein